MCPILGDIGYFSRSAGEWEAVRKVVLNPSSKDGSVYSNVGVTVER